jgi:hypothetical protein
MEDGLISLEIEDSTATQSNQCKCGALASIRCHECSSALCINHYVTIDQSTDCRNTDRIHVCPPCVGAVENRKCLNRVCQLLFAIVFIATAMIVASTHS